MSTFLPDLPPIQTIQPSKTPTLVQCSHYSAVQNMIPTVRGSYRAGYVDDQADYPALAANCKGGFVAVKTDGSRRLFLGSAVRLYEANQTVAYAWTDRSAGGAAYTTTAQWNFGQYRDYTIAVNKENNTQQSTTGAFSQLVAVKALFVVPTNNFILLGNVNYGTDDTDAVQWCDFNNPTSWTIASNTQAGRTSLTDLPGPLTAGMAFRDGVVIFKRKGMWLGQYVKQSPWWDFNLISPDYGCMGPKGVVGVEGGLVFVSDRDILFYDGSYPRSIADGVKDEFFADLYTGNDATNLLELQYDERSSVVFFKIVYSTASAGNTKDWAYNLKSRKWGRGDDRICQAVVNMTFSDAQAIPGISSTVATPADKVAAFFVDTARILTNLTTPDPSAAGASLTLAAVGNQNRMTTVKRITPILLTTLSDVTKVTGASYAGDTPALAYSGAVSTSVMDARYRLDVQKTGRWCGNVVASDVAIEFDAVLLTVQDAGEE